MTRRERHASIIAGFPMREIERVVRRLTYYDCVQVSLDFLTDAGVEAIACALVREHHFTSRLNVRNRALADGEPQ